jgi:hypothetical protein
LPVDQGVRRQELSSEARWKIQSETVREIYIAPLTVVNRHFSPLLIHSRNFVADYVAGSYASLHYRSERRSPINRYFLDFDCARPQRFSSFEPSEAVMQIQNRSVKILSALAVLAFLAAFATSASPTPAPEKTPANVAGTWAVHLSGDVGSGDQTFEIAQQDVGISGTFKGPYQSGKLEGTLDGHAIKILLSGPYPLRYNGTVEGDVMGGTVIGGPDGKTGKWSARRTKHA